jgi:hypothetical protein
VFVKYRLQFPERERSSYEKKRRMDLASRRSSKTDDFVAERKRCWSKAPTEVGRPVLPEMEAFAQLNAPRLERFEQKLE